MIIVRISGPFEQQLNQYAFGRECARLLHTKLKLDIFAYTKDQINQYCLNCLMVIEDIASECEIVNAKKIGIIKENTLLFEQDIFARIVDGMYLDGLWIDYRYNENVLFTLIKSINLFSDIDDEYRDIFIAIDKSDSVALDLRNPCSNQLILPTCYFEDAIKEIRLRIPYAHLFVLSNETTLDFTIEGAHTIIMAKTIDNYKSYLQLMCSCRHHIITYNSQSYWAARLNSKSSGLVIAPQQAFRSNDADLIKYYGSVQQPVWPNSWLVLPVRIPQTFRGSDTFLGGRKEGQAIRVGVWNFYEEITRNGFLFNNNEASIGANLLKPWVDIYQYGQSHGIDFVTIDQIGSVNDLDAVIFMDRPRSGNPLIDKLMQSSIQKYLMLYECDVIKPDNWDDAYHKQFDRIFTWSDTHVDGRRYIKNNFAFDPYSPYDFEVLKTAFQQRKLVTIIAGAKQSEHPNELYSHRIRTIQWFEASAPDDFDLFGIGWNSDIFHSYRGPVNDKLATLSHYRFTICYENAKNIPGYITEKLFDCFRAGTVPVYGGAPNIAHWIPKDCFIDINQFQTYFQMHEYLATMDSATHSAYLDRIRQYMNSEQAYPFTTECFIRTVTEIIVWDVQTCNGETPILLQTASTIGDDLAKVSLMQNLKTMQIELEVSQSKKTVLNNEQARRISFQKAERPELIVIFTYGDELPVFIRARALWQFFISHYPNVKPLFVRETEKLGRGEVQLNDYDLLIGIGGNQSPGTLESNGYAATGIWSASENGRCIYRQMAIYDYLLRTHNTPFYVYQSTITSVIDFRGLFALMDMMPKSACYAGMPGRMVTPIEYEGLTFVCGTNSLFSSDMLTLMRNRYNQDHLYATLPNDVWQALILHDIERIPMPFFSFIKPRADGGHNNNISILTKRLLNQGHYHFRVKTTSADAGYGLREDIDPWIMLKIMEAILETDSLAESNRQLIDKLVLSVAANNGKTLTAFNENNFFSGPRDFPLNDIEAEIIYLDLTD
jgi:hypothetical protein